MTMSNMTTVPPIPNISQKSRLVTLLFCVLLGIFGAHRFYVG